MSAKLFQTMILQVKDSISSEICVLDPSGVILASTNLSRIGTVDYQSIEFIQRPLETHYTDTYKKITDDNGRTQNIVSIKGTDVKSRELCALLQTTVASVNSLYDNKYDRSTFIKNVLLDNILPGDIYVKSSELDFDHKSSKIVLLIRKTKLSDTNLLDALTNFTQNLGHYVVYLNPRDIAVIFTKNGDVSHEEVLAYATKIRDICVKAGTHEVHIGIGNQCKTLENLSKSYKEAQIALEVSEVFDTDERIITYKNLGIGRLIYQLPTTLCSMFLNEVFEGGSIENLDEETLSTIKAFFENNLNVSETSRKLFVHRNTLVYRLEKIKKLTGLDLREFDHAIIFKVALMVRKYLDARDQEKRMY